MKTAEYAYIILYIYIYVLYIVHKYEDGSVLWQPDNKNIGHASVNMGHMPRNVFVSAPVFSWHSSSRYLFFTYKCLTKKQTLHSQLVMGCNFSK
jgi:hypothetical protein